MLPSIYRKPLSTSATTSPHKKTNFSQHERHLPEKLSSRNFSSSLKVKGPQHSQDGEWDASSISISECDAREIGNFDQHHRKGHKISIISQGAKSSWHSVIHLDNRFPQIVPQRQTKNRQQLYVTMESEKNKLETDEKKLDNNHDDPVCMGNKNWYKVIWSELKKQAKRIVNSEADADSSFDEAMSIDTCVTRRHSDSRSKLDKHFLPNENLAFPSSEDVEVKIESSDRVTFHKITPSVQKYMILESDIVYNNPLTPAVSSHVSIPDQNRNNEEKTDSLGDETQNLHKEKESNIQPFQVKKKFLKMSDSTHPEINVLPDEVKRKFIKMSKSIQPENRNNEEKDNTIGDKENEEEEEQEVADSCQENDENMAISENLVEINNASAGERSEHESARIRVYRNIIRNETCRMMRSIDMVVSVAKHLFGHERTQIFFDLLGDELFNFGSAGAAPGFIPNVTESTFRQYVMSFFEHSCDVMNQLITLLIGCPDRKRLQQMPEQNFISLMQYVIGSSLKTKIKGGKMLSTFVMVDSEEFENALGNEIPEDVLDRLKRGDEMVVYRFDTRLERTRDPQKRENRPILSIFFPSDHKLFIYIPTENGSYWHQNRKSEEKEDAARDEEGNEAVDEEEVANRFQENEGNLATSRQLVEINNASAGERSEHESARIRVYRNIIRNETCRMMRSIDMVVSVAKHLFGHERTQIFFDLLGDELFNFGSAGAAPGFIPNVTESTFRQYVMSFFEHSCDVMNQLITLLIGCPDRKRLQQMPEQNFISLMQYVIGSSLKTKIKGGKMLTSKGSTFVMVDSEEFENALGNEIPEDVLDRLKRGDEMVVYRFDTRLERTRDPQKRENRPILSIFFPSDHKLFIYIPTENGSYWHQNRKSEEKEDAARDEEGNEAVDEEEVANRFQENEGNLATSRQLVEINNASAGERSEHESARIRVYRNIIRNETCRMMRSIDMVVSVAKHLFGHERTQIFFDLLGDELFNFGSAGAAPGFIPNVTESTFRQYVMSFFEHSCDVMNQLITLLIGCPDRKRLQQMPEQNFISLMQYVIGSSLKTKIKGGKMLSTFVMVDSEEFENALGNEIPEDVLDRLKRGDEMVVYRFDTRLERTRDPQKRENRPILSIFFPSDHKLFIYIPTENGSYWHQNRKSEEKEDAARDEEGNEAVDEEEVANRFQENEGNLATSRQLVEINNASAGERSEHESARTRVYRNIIRNETCRKMRSIDMVVSVAKHLFGHERTQIFFDLLGDELFNFGSAGAAPGFIPNVTESTIRQYVMSFLEHSCDVMNQLITLLIGCPDRKRLQQMPEQNFISLMQSVIGSLLKTKIKGGKRLTSKGSTFVMVDSEEFKKALGNEIPEDVLDRLRRGDEMVVYRFDTRLERTRDPQKRENRPILSIFFPSDRKIFIYIPTENGSYWHQADMQRASRIFRNNK